MLEYLTALQGTTMNEQISLFLLCMDTLARQQSN